MNDLPEWIQHNKVQVGLSLIGLTLIGIGIWQATRQKMTSDSVVTISTHAEQTQRSAEENLMVMVDVNGAVERPGLYALQAGSRVNDALVAAGGLSAEANRDVVARNINLAEKVSDGEKIYIPFKSELTSGQQAVLGYGDGQVRVNSASKEQLESLWGVGEARAQTIIDNRPYVSIDDLMEKANLPQNVLDKNEGLIAL